MFIVIDLFPANLKKFNTGISFCVQKRLTSEESILNDGNGSETPKLNFQSERFKLQSADYAHDPKIERK